MSGKKTNGSGNGHDDHRDEDRRIVRFPSGDERRKKQQLKKESLRPANDRPAAPFFNFGRIPLFTRLVLLAFVAVQIGLTFAPQELQTQIVYTFGFVPAYFTGALKPFPYGAALSPITHIFIHGGWMHLAFNSVMAVSLGMFFEREFGTRRTMLFFFICGLAGALTYFALNPFSEVPVIGASGSVSGLFGALIMLMGKRGGLGRQTRGPWPLVAFWLVFMIATGSMTGGGIAWQAHIGGFLAGIGLLHLMQKGKIRL
ncbi:MAG: rhomboid family intramembrane serine protease [Alphaproteobacteria bacterium]